MRRMMTFLMGMIAGGLLLWGALNYHFVQAKDGIRMVPKVNASLADTFVDIRGFTVADWARHTDLALALTNANQRGLMEDAADDALKNSVDQWLKPAEQR